MAEKSIIKINKNKPTTIDFDLNFEGIDNNKKTSVRLIVEGVVNGCDISIKATQTKGGQWSVKVPNLKNFEDKKYNVFLEVVVDGYHFVPASGELEIVDEPTVKIVAEEKAVGELIEEGAMDAPASDAQVTNNLTGKPEFPIEAKTELNQGHNEHEAIDKKKLFGDKKTKIKDIAAKVDSHESTQLSAEMEAINVDGVAAKIISEAPPVDKIKPKKAGGVMSRRTRAEKLAEAEENSKRVRAVLGLPA